MVAKPDIPADAEAPATPATPATPANALDSGGLAVLPLQGVDGGRTPHVAVVPGEQVPLMAFVLPEGLRGLAREQVARRQYRDLAGQGEDRVELRPFAVVGTGAGGEVWTRMLAADSAALESWRNAAVARPRCRAVLPDYLALPAAHDVWVLSVSGGRVVARLGPDDGFAAETPLASRLIADRLRDAPPKAVVAPEGTPGPIATALEAAAVPVVAHPRALGPLGLSAPRAFAHNEMRLDLRQDPRLARGAMRRAVVGWGLPAIMGLVGFALWAGSLQVDSNRLAAAATEARDVAIATTRARFVPDGPILDIRAQVSRAMAAAQVVPEESAAAEPDPVALFNRAAGVLASADARVDGVVFTGAGPLTLDVTVPSFAALDSLAEALRQAGLGTEVVQAEVASGPAVSGAVAAGVRATLTLLEPAR